MGVGGWLRITLIIRLSQPQAGAWAWAWAELGKIKKFQRGHKCVPTKGAVRK